MLETLLSTLQASTTKIPKVALTEKRTLTIPEIVSVARENTKVEIKVSKSHEKKIEKVFNEMMNQVKQGVPIYGTTTAYGGRAGVHLNEGIESLRVKNATTLSNAIVHVDVTTGPIIPKEIARAAMLIRINMLLSGHSAIRLSTLKSYKKLLDLDITPLVGWYGTVGASGDLAHNGRVLSTLMHYKSSRVMDSKGKIKTANTLGKLGMKKLELMPKEGLALVNGDNFSTAASTMVADELLTLMFLNMHVAALNIQALKGSVRNFHPMLSRLRRHRGQEVTALILRTLLTGSKLAQNDLVDPIPKDNGELIQDVYSIRCLPQYYGPDFEALLAGLQTIETNANSVSDNPLWTTPETTVKGEEPYKWVSGGNFLAMHMSETMDRFRKIAIHIVKQNDRHLNRMVHPHLNNSLPANLSDKAAVSQTTFKGLQTQMGMYEVYATVLASPVNTAFGIHEELNQDLTSHALTSAMMTRKVLELVKLALATNLIASCQAIDIRGGSGLLSENTQWLYEWTRSQVPYIKKEQPLGHYVDMLAKNMLDNKVRKYLHKTLENAKADN